MGPVAAVVGGLAVANPGGTPPEGGAAKALRDGRRLLHALGAAVGGRTSGRAADERGADPRGAKALGPREVQLLRNGDEVTQLTQVRGQREHSITSGEQAVSAV
jgi:hypothetical protein